MAIIAYIGLPGAGKSYDVVANVVLPALRKGRVVYHNLQLKHAALMEAAGYRGMLVQIPDDADAEWIVANHPPGAIVVLDEIYQYWPAGITVSRLPKEQLEYFAKHRHSLDWQGRATNVYIVDQELSTTATFIRNRVDKTAIHRKKDQLGLDKYFDVHIYNRAVPLDSPPQSKYVRSLSGKYDPAVYACYKSHTLDSREGDAGEGDVLEERAEKRATIWGDWRLRFAGLGVLVLPALVYASIQSFTTLATPDQAGAGSVSDKRTAPAPAPVASVQADTANIEAETPPAAPASRPLDKLRESNPPQPERPKMSNVWRIAGVLTNAAGSGVVRLESPSGAMRLRPEQCEADDAGNWRCPVSDGIATMWSGARMVGDGHVLPMSAAAVAPGALQRSP